jgi:3-methyladenine DNA glycosylase AlkD
MMRTEEFLLLVEGQVQGHADPHKAAGMKAYMCDQFAFAGLMQVQRVRVLKIILPAFRSLKPGDWEEAVRGLWALSTREYAYLAMELCRKVKSRHTPEHIGLFEEMILTHSWWDTVDFIASNLVGELWGRYPQDKHKVIGRWMASGNIWLQRTCVIHQLKYREKTDAALLFSLCRELAAEQDFFIRKAIGWALRQFSKYDPIAVRAFLQSTVLSPLSTREASKYL